ncbi:hypothetical protein M514_21414 [Trichuris suis]|uniref:Uncharacterized protein n=1 Tax=Trichuris suis TaxID=68888 RepID=A0A085NA88_9BILA|nr:hypothetical protein M514_21414 [Trichuris suis]
MAFTHRHGCVKTAITEDREEQSQPRRVAQLAVVRLRVVPAVSWGRPVGGGQSSVTVLLLQMLIIMHPVVILLGPSRSVTSQKQ